MRNHTLRIRATVEEAAKIKDLAAARGQSLSELIRRAALGGRMPTRSFDQTRSALIARILGELGRIGGNLNQLTRRANVGTLTGHDLELSETLAGIDALRRRLRELLT